MSNLPPEVLEALAEVVTYNPARAKLTDLYLLYYATRMVDDFKWGLPTPASPSLILAHDSVTTMVLHKTYDELGKCWFQTELVIMHPNAAPWPGEHRHPHVDSIEIELFDCLNCTRNGEVVEFPDFVYHGRNMVHLLPTDFHSAPFKPNGSALLSCQCWHDMEPTSVGMDWLGEPVSHAHAQQQQAFAETARLDHIERQS